MADPRAPAPAASGPAATTAVAAPADPAGLDGRIKGIAAELRCLVCQNQTIADSQAPLAVDLKTQIRQLLLAGKSDAEVRDYMTQRYGDFVLYRPPLKTSTALLWGGPALLALGGAAALVFVLRRRQKLPAEAFEADPDAQADADRATAATAATTASTEKAAPPR